MSLCNKNIKINYNELIKYYISIPENRHIKVSYYGTNASFL